MTARPWGFGYKPSPPTLREKVGSKLASLRVSSDFTPSKHPRFEELFRLWGPGNQGQFSACTGFGVALAARLQSAIDGEHVPRLSPLLPYWAARARELGHSRVSDDGAMVPDVVWALNKFGTCSEAELPFSQHHINARPPPHAFRAALAMRSRVRVRMSRIVDAGDRLIQRAAHALHSNRVCMIAIPVGDEFISADGSRAIGRTPAINLLGWHFVVLLDWVYLGGTYSFLCANSWGSEWGDNGAAWLSSDLVKQTQGIWALERV